MFGLSLLGSCRKTWQTRLISSWVMKTQQLLNQGNYTLLIRKKRHKYHIKFLPVAKPPTKKISTVVLQQLGWKSWHWLIFFNFFCAADIKSARTFKPYKKNLINCAWAQFANQDFQQQSAFAQLSWLYKKKAKNLSVNKTGFITRGCSTASIAHSLHNPTDVSY